MKIILSILMLLSVSYGASCRPYIPYLKLYSEQIISKDFPYWYLIGQDYQESNCRFVRSRDGVGSESPAQITWKVWGKTLKRYGIRNLKTTRNFTKSQVLIMNILIDKARNKGYNKLWVPFQAYNGGWLVLKELSRTPTRLRYMQYEVSKRCRRKIIHFKNGQSISACKINYEYPIKISEHTARYYSDLIKETRWLMY